MKKLFPVLLLFISLSVFADVKLPRIFSDNMVLQRDRPILVWGWASPREKITIQFNEQSKTVTTGKDGKWKMSLNPERAGGPYTLSVSGKNAITLDNVLVGDVWVCSGQSNMEWTVRNSNNAAEEIINGKFPMIRHFKVPNTVASEPQDDIGGGEWKICTPENVGDFTAVGYFFARELNREMNVPIGLLNTSWGGTHSETWTSREAFENSDEFKDMIADMPKLDLEAIAKQKSEAIIKRIESLQGPLNVSADVIGSWKEPVTDDSNWAKMKIPGWWEGQSLGEFDGTVWFRTSVNLTASDLGNDATLDLAMIDDSDVTYVNGTRVGSMSQYNDKRSYVIPARLLKNGKNVIAVKVVDTGGGGGIYGDASNVRLITSGRTIPLAGAWAYRVEEISKETTTVGPNSYPTLLFNAMIHPFLNFSIKGAIWYQGESNAGRAYQYRKAFPLMINDWRKRWGIGHFPFYFVQLASYNANHGTSETGSGWAELREAQAMTLFLPNTGMAVTTDIGDPHDIHPRNKQDVGKRLAALALHRTYDKKDLVDSGPMFQSMKVEGDKAIIAFTDIGSGLITPDPYGYLRGFEIAGEDRKFRYAKAFIDGNTVVVYREGVSKPAAVRFGWADNASDNNLFNAEGFPAAPFRTDAWRGVTENAKFTINK